MIPTLIDDDVDAARARNRKMLQGYATWFGVVGVVMVLGSWTALKLTS